MENEQGTVLEVTLGAPAMCPCGRTATEGEKVSLWKSSFGPDYDRLASCPACTRPKGLIQERNYLVARIIPGAQIPFELQNELDGNWFKIMDTIGHLLGKLPRCSECPTVATYMISQGPFYCDVHAQEHPTATEVPWGREVQLLGLDVED
jgi:hypothetical protein